MINSLCIILLCIVLIVITSCKSNDYRGGYTNALRGFAILIIILHHFSSHWTRLFTPFGGVGVAIFLLLSGYGLNESFKKNGLKHYWLKRIIRVWIPYFIFITLLTTINHHQVIDYLLDISCIRTSYWYIGYLAKFYVVYWITTKYIPKYRIPIILLYSVSTLFWMQGVEGEQALSFVAGLLFSEKQIQINGKYQGKLILQIILFLTGTSFLLFKQTPIYRNIDDVGLISNILINLIQMLIKLPYALLIIFCMGLWDRIWNNRFIWLSGIISYELYLVHMQFYSYSDSLTKSISFITAAFLLSYVFHKFNDKIKNIILTRR